jgi:hypothetical protein
VLKLTNSAATAGTNNLIQPAGNPACKQQLQIKRTSKGVRLIADISAPTDAQLSAIGRRLLDLLHT